MTKTSMDEELMKALEADGAKLETQTGEDHGPHDAEDYLTNLTEIAHLKGVNAALLQVAHRWAMVMWQSGISPVEGSMDPLESLVFDTQAALFKATGRDVVADTLEKITAGNRRSIAEGR